MRSTSEECSQIFAQAICIATGEGCFQFGVILFPHGNCFGEAPLASGGEGEQASAAVCGIGSDLDQSTAFEGLEGGGEGSAIHREECGHGGHPGGDRPIERHHQGELSVGQSEGAESVVEAPRKRSRGPLHMEAEAAIPDLDCGLVGDVRVAGVCAS
jgi:hypothetical protein